MNRKQLIILLVLVVVLGIAGLALYQRNQTSWQGGGRQGTALKLEAEKSESRGSRWASAPRR